MFTIHGYDERISANMMGFASDILVVVLDVLKLTVKS